MKRITTPTGYVIDIAEKDAKVITDLIFNGKKLEAIKHLRSSVAQKTNYDSFGHSYTSSTLGLKEAKDMVEFAKNWQPVEPEVKQFEYKVYVIYSHDTNGELESLLNHWGAVGWELVGSNNNLLFLKRTKS